MSTANNCIHCDLPIPPADLVIDEIDGKELRFCCRGCQGVYHIINGAGLNNFYQRRDWSEQGVPSGVFEAKFDETLLANHVISHSDDSAEISLIIEGIRPGRVVRVRPESWPRMQIPREEYLFNNRPEDRFPTPAIFPKY